MSQLNSILDAVVTRVASLGLIKDSVVIPVVKRKLPRRQETMDSPTTITVSPPDAPDSVIYAAFGAQWWSYTVNITVVSPNDQDLASNIDTYTGWRDQIKALFMPPFASPPLVGVPLVWDMRVKPQVLFHRSMLAMNYDYQQIAVEFLSTA